MIPGEVALRKNTRLGYVSQDSRFAEGQTDRQVIRRALDQSTVAEDEKHTREAETLSRVGFEISRPGRGRPSRAGGESGSRPPKL